MFGAVTLALVVAGAQGEVEARGDRLVSIHVRTRRKGDSFAFEPPSRPAVQTFTLSVTEVDGPAPSVPHVVELLLDE